MSTVVLASDLEHEVLLPRSWKLPIGLSVFALLAALGFGLSLTKGEASMVAIVTGTRGLGTINLSFPSQGAIIFLSVLMFALVAVSWWSSITRTARLGPFQLTPRLRIGAIRISAWVGTLFGVFFVSAFLLWAVAGRGLALQFTSLLSGALFLSTPLIFGAMAGTVCERVGVINVSIEGQLLAGAFLAAVVGSATGNPWLGLLAAPIAGALVGALLALFAVRYWVDHIIVGVVLNVFVTGVTSYLFSTVLARSQTFSLATRLPTWKIPLLSEIPVLGPVLFAQNALVYIMYIAVIVLQIMLFKSRWGLRLRACGEHPRAADTAGIKVNMTRVINTILGGAIAGLGGAFFTIANGLAFGKGMSAGRGFIALAAMILGGWKPKGALIAALLFGFADNLQNALGVVGVEVPSQFMLMAPYLVTIFAVAGLVGRVRPPAMEGKPYKG
ncbi:MAG: ABC transporter permease [Propionibacteriaceae bacterium]|jgi:simple sugar transport system permease protein|nr:ABC transporter permease [Propionibacteriaceae bacterium]